MSVSLFQHLHEGLLITDADLRALDVNPAYTQILGVPRDELLGTVPSLLRPAPADPVARQQRANAQSDLDAAGEADKAPHDAPADTAKDTPRTFSVLADNSDAAGMDQPVEYPDPSEQEPEPEAIAFEMDEPPGHAEAMPDGPVMEGGADDEPDEAQPKQGLLW